MPQEITRRAFLSMSAKMVAAGCLAGVTGYSFYESGAVEVHALSIPIPELPSGFEGLRIALLTDLHHGFFISRDYIARAVILTKGLQPDLILLAGDYIHDDQAYIAPVMEELGKLHAPLGVYGVQGNRDIRVNRMLVSKELARNGIVELTNQGGWITRRGSRLWLCGLDDYTIGRPVIAEALRGATSDATIIALTHNPHFADYLTDARVKLMLSGHTHGGQVNLPLLGRPFLPGGCEHYAYGLIEHPLKKVFISAGVGSVFPPLRFRCPPEIALLTLVNC